MKLVIKTLRQVTYEIEIDEDETVENLKKKIEEVSNNELSASEMNVIYAGKILENDRTLRYYNINGDRFVVAMSKSKVGINKGEATTSKEVQTPERKPDSEKSKSQSEEKLKPIDENAASSLEKYSETEMITDPDKIEEVIETIAAMGYPPDKVRIAFQAASNNPERTVEFLVSGYPDDLGDVSPDESPAQSPAPSSSSSSSSSSPSPQPGDLWYIDPAALQLRRERENRELNEWMRREDAHVMNLNDDLEDYHPPNPAEDIAPNRLASSRNLAYRTARQNQANNPIDNEENNNNLNYVRPVPLRPNQGNNANQIQPNNIRVVIQNIRENQADNLQLPHVAHMNQRRNPNHRNVNESPFNFLRVDPRFIHMRHLIQNNPNFMRALLVDIAHNNVELLEMINNNQQAFVDLINDNQNQMNIELARNGNALHHNGNAARLNGNPARLNGNAARLNGNAARLNGNAVRLNANGVRGNFNGVRANANGIRVIPPVNPRVRYPIANGNGNAVNANGGVSAHGLVVLQLSEADRAAIQRLRNLGFTEELCIEAYLTCDKNEDLAANYLSAQHFEGH